MTRRRRARRIFVWLILGLTLSAVGGSSFYVNYIIPDHLNLIVSEEEFFNIALPPGVTFESECEEVVLGNTSNIPDGQVNIQPAAPISMYGTTKGTYHIGMKLFGIIQMKDIQIDVVDDMYATPVGEPVGIYLKSDGVMVIGTGEIVNEAGNLVEPAFGILKSGDYIESVNGLRLETKNDLIDAVNDCSGEPIRMEVRREGQIVEINMQPAQAEDGTYKLGAWVRDDTQGIGTMTYVTQNGAFGALGHGISDSDTGQLVSVSGGELYETEILGIEKGRSGTPGVLSGVIYYGPSTRLGEVTGNENEGIFGIVNDAFRADLDSEPVLVGYRQDVKKGPAVIRSSVSGEVRDYDIEIQKVDHACLQENKGMTIKVVDEELLELTGGIVQGMGVIDNRDNTEKPENTGFFAVTLSNDPTTGV